MVFNLESEGLHTYFVAGGALVHNMCAAENKEYKQKKKVNGKKKDDIPDRFKGFKSYKGGVG